MDQPTQPPETRTADDEHLRLLVVFHYIAGGLMALFSCIFIGHIVLGLAMLFRPELLDSPNDKGPGFPPLFGAMFVIGGGSVVLFGWTMAFLTIYSGRSIQQRRRRLFSLVVAGMNCMWMPLGTILGALTIVALLRPSVKAQYGEQWP